MLYRLSFILYISTACLLSCKKDWLDKKPDKALVIPTTLSDMRALLDNGNVFHRNNPALHEMGADNYVLSDQNLAASYFVERNAYLWASDVFEGASADDWNFAYRQILYCNTVLDGLSKIGLNNSIQSEHQGIQGSAYFLRSLAFHNLAQIFCKAYDNASAHNDPGLPLRLTSNVNDKVTRSTVKQTYDQIIDDLKRSSQLLPTTTTKVMRPSKAAAYALMARTYLSMSNYNDALLYADSALQLNNSLLDFSTLNANAAYPIRFPNPEILYSSVMIFYGELFLNATVDTNLYKSYQIGDLRRVVFFDSSESIKFKGSYYGLFTLFSGLASDEMYLTRAECHARLGNKDAASDDLNTLLRTRWTKNAFVELTAVNADDALKQVLSERRKELVFRGIRWTDLRRLNKEPAFAVTLARRMNGINYTLPPNDNRYVYPIPDDEIRLSGLIQNPR
jgi:starch-binding outer membrane protein, SusD/RagB family